MVRDGLTISLALSFMSILGRERPSDRLALHPPRRHHPARTRVDDGRSHGSNGRGKNHARRLRTISRFADGAAEEGCRIRAQPGTKDWHPTRPRGEESLDGSTLAESWSRRY